VTGISYDRLFQTAQCVSVASAILRLLGGFMGREKSIRFQVGAAQWAHGLGEERYTRDECAARTVKSQEEDAARTSAASVERWPAIVAGIRLLADAYNTGARRAVLNVVEQAGQAAVTITASGDGTASLTAVLEDTLICVHARDAGGVSCASEVRLRPDRGDDATAAYLLQNWMQRL
jgi:hypothetical protein